jgi:hypothetical protein
VAHLGLSPITPNTKPPPKTAVTARAPQPPAAKQPHQAGCRCGPCPAVVAEPGGHGGQVDRHDEAATRVVPKPMRVDVGHIRAPAQLGEQVLDATRSIRAAFAAKDRLAWLLNQLELQYLERLSRVAVERQTPVFVTLADDVDPARAWL